MKRTKQGDECVYIPSGNYYYSQCGITPIKNFPGGEVISYKDGEVCFYCRKKIKILTGVKVPALWTSYKNNTKLFKELEKNNETI